MDFTYIDKWIIVYDMNKIKENPLLFKDNPKVIELIHFDAGSRSGNAQRNFALDYIKDQNNTNNCDENTYIYFLDDDNIIHPDLYKLFEQLEDNRIYTFGQKRDPKYFPYVSVLKGDIPEIYMVDSAMTLMNYKLIKDIRWKIDKYNADGVFIKECIMKNSDNWVYVDQILSDYNVI
jgi:hypothetical protein